MALLQMETNLAALGDCGRYPAKFHLDKYE